MLKYAPSDLTVDADRPQGVGFSHHRIRWGFNGQLEEAVTDTIKRLETLRKDSANHPSGLSVEWDGKHGRLFVCEISFDRDDRR